MNSDLEEYLEYLCSENNEISNLMIVSEEGLPIAFASSITGFTDQTLISGMCTALKCIGKELIQETTNSNFNRMLVDCTDGVILIHPLSPRGILVVSCKNAAVLSKLDVTTIQSYFSTNQDQLVAM